MRARIRLIWPAGASIWPMNGPKADVYRDLAGRRTGEERDIVLALAAAEGRHEQHWLTLLGEEVGKPRRPDLRTRALGFLVRHFGSVFVLALVQRAEGRSVRRHEVRTRRRMTCAMFLWNKGLLRLWQRVSPPNRGSDE
jgi:hypothetical protein